MPTENILILGPIAELALETQTGLHPSSASQLIPVANTKQAAAKLHENTVRAAVVHLNTPGLYDFLLQARSSNPNLQLILVCEADQTEVPVSFLSLGINACLHEPLNLQDILNVLQDSLETQPDINYKNLVKELSSFNNSLEQRIKEATVLQGIGRSVNVMLDLEAVLNRVVEAATFVTNAEEGYLMLLEEETSELYLRAAKNMDERRAQITRLKINDTIAGTVVQSGKPIILRGDSDRRFKVKTGYLVHSLINVPLKIGDRVIGILGVDNPASIAPFTMDDLRRLTTLAANAAQAIENARTYEKISQTLTNRIDELDLLQSLIRELNVTTDPELIAQIVLSRSLKATQAQVSVLGWVGSDKPLWVSQGTLPHQLMSGAEINNQPWWDEKILERVMHNGKASLVSKDNNGFNGPKTKQPIPHFSSRLTVPIKRGEKVLGVINLESAAPNAFNNNHLRLMHAIADQSAIALYNADVLKTVEQNQSQLNLITHHITDAVWLVDANLSTIQINHAACSILGQKTEQITGLPITSAWLNSADNADHNKIMQHLEQCLARQTEIPFTTGLKISAKNGRRIAIEGAAYPLMADEYCTGAALIFRPVTAHQETERLQADFISMASHNLRTPLMSIQAALDFVLEAPTDEAKRTRLLNDARLQSQKIAAFLRELLDISQLASGREIPIRIKPVNFSPLLENIIEDYQTSSPQTKLNVKSPPILPLISADELKLEIILRNLINHASRRSAPNSPLTIAVEEREDDILIAISDSGPAISPNHYEQIFWHVYALEPDKDLETMPYGYTIGLFTTRRLVELLGGSIWAEESDTNGACVKFTLSIWR